MSKSSKEQDQLIQISFPDSHDILMDAPIGIFTSTPDGRYISVNRALARMYGYDSPEDMIASVKDISGQVYVDPEDRKEFMRLLEDFGEVVNHECRMLRQDGSEFWVSKSARIVKKSKEQVVYQGFATDITDRKQAEFREHKSEERFRLMFTNAPMPYQSLDEQGNFLDVNQTFLDVLGYTHEELIGKNFGEILHPDWRDHFKENFPRFKAVGEILGVEFELVKKDQSTILAHFNGKIQRDDQGRFQRTHCIFQDVTERKRNEEYLRQVLEATDDGIWDYDLVTGSFACSERFAEMLGYKPEEIKNFGCFCEENIHPQDADNFRSAFEGYISGRLPTYATEFRLKTKQGDYKWIYTRGQALQRDASGRALRVVGAHTDISKRKQTEDELRKRENFIKSTLDNLPVGVAINSVDPEVKFIYMNDNFLRFYRTTREELTEKDFWEAVYQDPEYREKIRKTVLEDCASKDFSRMYWKDVPVSRPGEEPFYITAKNIPLPDSNLMVSTVWDVTDRKLTEDALRESEERFKALHNASFGGITIHDKGLILECNLGLSEITGYGYEELIGMDGLLLIAEHSREMVMNNILAGYEKPYEAIGVRKNGQEYPVRLEARNIPYKGKNVRVVEFRDITEQKQAEYALHESEARFRNLFEHVPTVAVQGYGMDGKTLFWNKASERFYGFSSEEAIGKNLVDLIIPDEMRQDVTQEMKTMRESNIPVPATELQLKRKDGSRIHVYSSHAIVQRPNQPSEMFCIDIDLTELKQTEAELVQAKEQAESANQAKSEFLANMSHEIRTPLNGIMGMMQLLETTSLDQEQQGYLHMCLASANRLTRLLSDILDLSRIESGQMVIRKEEVDVKRLCDAVNELFMVTSQDKNISLEFSSDLELPGVFLGDEGRLQQILFNLVGNAIKYTEQGKVSLDIMPLPPGRGEQLRLLFTISDTGIGIPEDRLKVLFQPFSQVDGSYSRRHQGAGLGLAIVKRLVDLMGGNISVDSTEGKGTTVYVSLPFRLSSEVTMTNHKQPEHLLKAKQNLQILLAEDEFTNQFATQKLLERMGHTVTIAGDGQQVLDLLQKHEFDCILMDIQMPIMDGVEATRMVRSSDDFGSKKDIPIIAMTAHAMDGDRDRFLAAGMNDYISKPVQVEDLEKVLERYSY
ncbi:PAS domain-containing hybrid sensor histidine kinase/response regulator [Desulfonatronovibrio hydrogenovorans]|uniref:PAS domain-containing hybrid sensor histidine kinase/response regulator n=1 Tax=Desulfonatronovibrio hydrogenovorans TaxID=53245 RepID=UPI0006900177|nr:PAS domain-containing hybrid sensor histidine kinase/response regulator [Desulfonatronovibrio hydrogenovorans]